MMHCFCGSSIIKHLTGRTPKFCSSRCRLVSFRSTQSGTYIDDRSPSDIYNSFVSMIGKNDSFVSMIGKNDSFVSMIGKNDSFVSMIGKNDSSVSFTRKNDSSVSFTRKPKVLDLFCGAGGASVGLALAGYEVTGVDLSPQPNYPFEFIQSCVTDLIPVDLLDYDFIWASPPCQAHSTCNFVNKISYDCFIDYTRELLLSSGKSFVIENVPLAPLLDSFYLDGTMFSLGVIRKRIFESNHVFKVPLHRTRGDIDFVTVAGNGSTSRDRLSAWSDAMGINWMSKKEIKQAIPPIYSWYLASQLKYLT